MSVQRCVPFRLARAQTEDGHIDSGHIEHGHWVCVCHPVRSTSSKHSSSLCCSREHAGAAHVALHALPALLPGEVS